MLSAVLRHDAVLGHRDGEALVRRQAEKRVRRKRGKGLPAATPLESLAKFIGMSVSGAAEKFVGMSEEERMALRMTYATSHPEGLPLP